MSMLRMAGLRDQGEHRVRGRGGRSARSSIETDTAKAEWATWAFGTASRKRLHCAALIGLEIPERDPAQTIERHQRGDGLGDPREQSHGGRCGRWVGSSASVRNSIEREALRFWVLLRGVTGMDLQRERMAHYSGCRGAGPKECGSKSSVSIS